MNKTLKLIALLTAMTVSSISAVAEEVELDKVAVLVDGSVVLESEIQELIKSIKAQAEQKNQNLPSDQALRVQVTEKLINDSLMLQMGERMGIQVSDAQLDDTINNMAKGNNQTVEAFRESLIAQGINYEKYRETVRTELITGEVKRNAVGRRIYISPQEISNLMQLLKEQTNNNEEYRLGHILIDFPPEPTQKDINDAKKRADRVIELLNEGGNFAEIAIASSGGANALEGGDLGWKGINELPTLFSEIIDGKEKGTVLGPIRSGLGFSIVKIQDIRGREIVEVEEVRSRHIIIKPSIILSETKAEEMLKEFKRQIEAGEAKFEDLAKEHSEDGTAIRGGDLGWSDPGRYDPAFSDALARLKENEIHEPFRTSFGWHIVELTGRRMLDATQQMNENKAHQLLYRRKFGMEEANWLKEIRDEAYIEVIE